MKRVRIIGGNKYDQAKAAKQIAEAIMEYGSIGLQDVLDRNRPYTGQWHTDDGERGKQVIEGLTLRDLRDCFILALYDSAPGIEGNPPKSVSDLPFEDMDLMAVSQNMACWVERYMGIFPNVQERGKWI